MAETFIHYITIANGEIASEAAAVPVNKTDRVHQLIGEIARATCQGASSVRLWKARIEPFSPGKRPASDDEEDLAVRWQKRARRARSLGAHVPLFQVSQAEYFNFQTGETPIFDGRYTAEQNTVALPVEIFYDGFAEFNADCHDESLEVEPEILKLTIQLMDASSRIVNRESERQCTSRDLIHQLIQYSLTQTTLPNRPSADRTTLHIRRTEPFGTAALAIVEEKGELGTSGEGSIQGCFSFVRHWADRQNEKLFDASLCPCFIVSISGPWIVILGAVFTSCAIVQRLTDYLWLGHSRVIDETRAVSIARVFSALGRAVRRLDRFYETLSLPSNPSDRFFPLTRSYIDPQDPEKCIQFSYVAPLKGEDPSCVAYLARTTDDNAIVIKFVERYGVEAHTLLAAHNLAPPLLYYGKIWPQHDRDGCAPRKMVVMDYIDGEPVDKNGVSEVACVAVLKAVRLLHEHGYVHGDIRWPNILIPEGEGDEEGRVMLLDFDWAGREGEVRYPHRLSRGLWVEGVDDGELIRREHDLGMVDRLRFSTL
ncbi:hypothetical protein MD484_g8294, partial [Candolleomyces efflorescens]